MRIPTPAPSSSIPNLHHLLIRRHVMIGRFEGKVAFSRPSRRDARADLSGHDRHQPQRCVPHRAACDPAPHCRWARRGHRHHLLLSGAAVAAEPGALRIGQERPDRAEPHPRAGAGAAPHPGQHTAPHQRRHGHEPERRHPTPVPAQRGAADARAVRTRYTTLNALPIPWVESEDVTKALLFLASDDARYVTGVALPIDAGFALI